MYAFKWDDMDIGEFAEAVDSASSKVSKPTLKPQPSASGVDQRFAATMDYTRGAVNPSQYLSSGIYADFSLDIMTY